MFFSNRTILSSLTMNYSLLVNKWDEQRGVFTSHTQAHTHIIDERNKKKEIVYSC